MDTILICFEAGLKEIHFFTSMFNPRHVGHLTFFKLKFMTLASNPERNLLCSAKVARGGFQFPTTNQVHNSAQPVPVRTPVQWTQFSQILWPSQNT